MPVKSTHCDYVKALPRYELIRAIVNNDAKEYIRKPDRSDTCRNEQYRNDAILTNFTNLTLEAFLGLIFSKKLKLSLPPELTYLLDDATGTGINIWQFSQYCASELLQVGRLGLLEDYDIVSQKAYIKPYRAEAIINWKTRPVNGVVKPWLITLAESITLDELDVFSQETEMQYRVLRLSDDDVYYQEIYNANEELIEVIPCLNSKGENFNYIPFVFPGSVNNDWDVDKQPLFDMAVLNLGHYKNSADYEESIWVCGQPYVHVDIGEGNQDDFNAANPNGIDFGSRKGLITQKGRVDLVQANPNQLAAQAMNDKLEQAARTGARMIEPSGGRETAEAARIRYSSQNSILTTLTSNLSWAIEDGLKGLCAYMGANPDLVKFKLNDEFYDATADGNIMTAYTNWFDRGVVSADELRDYGRKTGIIDADMTDDEIENAVDLSINPLEIYDITQQSTTSSTPFNEDSGDAS